VGPVRVCVPHEILLNVGVVAGTGYTLITSVSETPSAEAVRVTFFVELTADDVTLKAAELSPLATETVEGTLSALLLLESSVTVICFFAGALKVTEQALV